jgi:VCBS repeat-containing protein
VDGAEGVYDVTVDFPGVNDAPAAGDDAYTTNEDEALAVAAPGLLANDADPEGRAMIASIVSGPVQGAVSLHADGSFTYAPVANFNGTDRFTYKVTDSDGAESSPATVTITVTPVNDPPVALGETYVTAEDTTLTAPAPGVLANDTDVDGSALSAVVESTASSGALVLNADGSFTYTPAPNFNGTDQFTYRATDGALSSTATVTIRVTPVNDPPLALGDSYRTPRGTPLRVAAPGVLSNDGDVDSTSLTAIFVAAPSHGTVSLASDGSFTYTPSATFVGVDSFQYKASDGAAESNVATVSITVEQTSGAPIARDDSFTARKNLPRLVLAPGVLANDTSATGAKLTAVLVRQPSHGVVLLLPNGAFLYLPFPNFVGTDAFLYKASDGISTSNVATVTMKVAATP